jgi:RNA polymerase sigma-70 factor (ECF subfamily)
MLATTEFGPVLTQPPRDDAEGLVAACRAGDARAWRALYEAHFDFAWRTARRLGTPEADVEDVVHEAFAVAWKRLKTFTFGRFTTWLYQIVAHVVSAHLRQQRVRGFFHELFAGQRRDDEVASPEGAVEARRSLEAVERLLRKLSDKKREVFALSEFEGLSAAEIGTLVGCPPETVRTRLHAARREFEALARTQGVWP